MGGGARVGMGGEGGAGAGEEREEAGAGRRRAGSGTRHLRGRVQRNGQDELLVGQLAVAVGRGAGVRLDGRERTDGVVCPGRALVPAGCQPAVRRVVVLVGQSERLRLTGHRLAHHLAHGVRATRLRTAATSAARAALRAAPCSSLTSGRRRCSTRALPFRLRLRVHVVDSRLPAMHGRSATLHASDFARCAHPLLHTGGGASSAQPHRPHKPPARVRARETRGARPLKAKRTGSGPQRPPPGRQMGVRQNRHADDTRRFLVEETFGTRVNERNRK